MSTPSFPGFGTDVPNPSAFSSIISAVRNGSAPPWISAVSATATATITANLSTSTGSPATSSVASPANVSSHSTSIVVPVVVAIIVVLVVAAISGFLIWFLLRRRKQARTQRSASSPVADPPKFDHEKAEMLQPNAQKAELPEYQDVVGRPQDPSRKAELPEGDHGKAELVTDSNRHELNGNDAKTASATSKQPSVPPVERHELPG